MHIQLIKKNKLNYGNHLGFRLNMNNINLDFRYEKANSSEIIDLENFENTDLRTNKIILRMFLKLN